MSGKYNRKKTKQGPSEKKARVTILPPKKGFTFKQCESREATMQDMVNAEMISGTMKGWRFNVALMAVTCKFDGKSVPFEDLLTMSSADFLEVNMAGLTELQSLLKQLSGSNGKEDSQTDES